MQVSFKVIFAALITPSQLGLALPLVHPSPAIDVSSAPITASVPSQASQPDTIATRDDISPGIGRGGGYDTDSMQPNLPSFAVGHNTILSRRNRGEGYINERSKGIIEPRGRGGGYIIDRSTTPPSGITGGGSPTNSTTPWTPNTNAAGSIASPGEALKPGSAQPTPTFWIRDTEPEPAVSERTGD